MANSKRPEQACAMIREEAYNFSQRNFLDFAQSSELPLDAMRLISKNNGFYSLARVQSRTGVLGSGFTAVLRGHAPGEDSYYFITNHHVLKDVEDFHALNHYRLQFLGTREKLEIHLTEFMLGRRMTFDTQDLDVSIIEVRPEYAASWQTQGVRFIPISRLCKDLKITRESLKKETLPVIVLQHAGGRPATYSFGNLVDILPEQDGHVTHTAPTEAGSSGSPIIDYKTWSVVAVHYGVRQGLKYATSLEVVLERFSKSALLQPPQTAQELQSQRGNGSSLVQKTILKRKLSFSASPDSQSSLKSVGSTKLEDSEPNKEWLRRLRSVPNREWEYKGDGRFGKVFKVDRKNDKPPLAVKVLAGCGPIEDYLKQLAAFNVQFKLFSELSHPRLVKMFAFVVDFQDTKAYIVMEYVACRSVQDLITGPPVKRPGHLHARHRKEGDPLPTPTAFKYLKQVLEGLSYLHNNHIIHGNLKPSELLVTEKDDIKLSDIGLATHMKWPAHSPSLSKPEYFIPPEVVRGEDRTFASDMWSIGATFVTMVTGKFLNHNQPRIKALSAISMYELEFDGRPLDMVLKDPDVSNEVKTVLTYTLVIPMHRHSAQALLEELDPSAREKELKKPFSPQPAISWPMALRSFTSALKELSPLLTPKAATAPGSVQSRVLGPTIDRSISDSNILQKRSREFDLNIPPSALTKLTILYSVVQTCKVRSEDLYSSIHRAIPKPPARNVHPLLEFGGSLAKLLADLEATRTEPLVPKYLKAISCLSPSIDELVKKLESITPASDVKNAVSNNSTQAPTPATPSAISTLNASTPELEAFIALCAHRIAPLNDQINQFTYAFWLKEKEARTKNTTSGTNASSGDESDITDGMCKGNVINLLKSMQINLQSVSDDEGQSAEALSLSLRSLRSTLSEWISSLYQKKPRPSSEVKRPLSQLESTLVVIDTDLEKLKPSSPSPSSTSSSTYAIPVHSGPMSGLSGPTMSHYARHILAEIKEPLQQLILVLECNNPLASLHAAEWGILSTTMHSAARNFWTRLATAHSYVQSS